MAPNLITLSAIFFSMLPILLMAPTDPNLEQAFPFYYYLICAWGVLMYQTFDAVDGKHARNTGQSSPLGQLFDHGCDAVNSNFFIYLTLHCNRTGPNNIYFMMIFGCFVSFQAHYDCRPLSTLANGKSTRRTLCALRRAFGLE